MCLPTKYQRIKSPVIASKQIDPVDLLDILSYNNTMLRTDLRRVVNVIPIIHSTDLCENLTCYHHASRTLCVWLGGVVASKINEQKLAKSPIVSSQRSWSNLEGNI